MPSLREIMMNRAKEPAKVGFRLVDASSSMHLVLFITGAPDGPSLALSFLGFTMADEDHESVPRHLPLPRLPQTHLWAELALHLYRRISISPFIVAALQCTFGCWPTRRQR